MLVMIAAERVSNNKGIINVKVTVILEKNVENVASHISFAVCLASDSSDIWMLSASENESATAIMIIPPRITSFECVPECSPTISPSVVIIADVMPKLNPVFIECFMIKNADARTFKAKL